MREVVLAPDVTVGRTVESVAEVANGWSVGELARRAGVTVRTLHHYDRIGLLRPGRRTAAGHRRYSEAEIARLYAITAWRQLGLSLAEVAAVLEPATDDLVSQTVRRQLSRVAEHVDALTDLRQQLEVLDRQLARGGTLGTEDLINATELTTMTSRLESIVTRTGDDGTTSLSEGDRIPKTDPILVAMGDIDELQASLGVIVSHPEASSELSDALREIINDLFDLGSDLGRAQGDTRQLADDRTDQLEEQIRTQGGAVGDVALPVLPTGGAISSLLHVARTTCRRAERSTVGARRSDAEPGVRYLNRLSDLLFVMALACANEYEPARTVWAPGPRSA